MISNITINNFILIDNLDIDLSTGFNVFTGETGAGKSIILDAIGFVMGDRVSNKVIRTGSDSAFVSIVFDKIPDIVRSELDNLEIATESLIIRRFIGNDGKSKSFINDVPVAIATIKNIRNNLIRINSQHEQTDLLDESSHITTLDKFIGNNDLFSIVKDKYNILKALESEKQALLEQKERLEQEQSYLEYVYSEISTINPRHGEEDELLEARSIAANRNKINELLHDISTELEACNIEGSIAKIQKTLLRNQSLVNDLGLSVVSDKLDEIYGIISIVNDEIYSKTTSIEFDQSELDAIDIRLMELRNLARKYRIGVSELPDYFTQISEKINKFSNIESLIEQKTKEILMALNEYKLVANELSNLRTIKAKQLEIHILEELKDLRMDKVEFVVKIEPNEKPKENGLDNVIFNMRTNKGSRMSSISEALSGGELSRFILSASIIIAENTESTMIFDEIDTGVGGQTAYAIGKKLHKLAEKHQVMAITHQPQVACFAKEHYHITKQTDEVATFTKVTRLDYSQRTHELARMMSGDEVTEEATSAAIKLLEEIN